MTIGSLQKALVFGNEYNAYNQWFDFRFLFKKNPPIAFEGAGLTYIHDKRFSSDKNTLVITFW